MNQNATSIPVVSARIKLRSISRQSWNDGSHRTSARARAGMTTTRIAARISRAAARMDASPSQCALAEPDSCHAEAANAQAVLEAQPPTGGEQRAPREALAHTSYFTTGLSPCPGEPNTRDAPAVLLLVDSTQYHVAVDGR